MKNFPMISKMSCLVAVFSALMLTGCTYAQMRVYNDPNSTQAQRDEVHQAGMVNLMILHVFGINEHTKAQEQAGNETLDCFINASSQCYNDDYNYNTPSYNYGSNCTRTYSMATHSFVCI